MHDAPRYDPLEASPVFPKGSSAQPLVPGTVPRGTLNEDELLHTGRVMGAVSDAFPFPITRVDLDRGEQRFNIYCAPCHGRTGEGNGMVVQRGYKQPPSFHIDRLRSAPPGYFYDTIANGFGVMPSYAAQVPVADRWAITAYIGALQLSQHATLADVPAADRAQLEHPSTSPSAAKDAGDERAHGAAGRDAGGH